MLGLAPCIASAADSIVNSYPEGTSYSSHSSRDCNQTYSGENEKNLYIKKIMCSCKAAYKSEFDSTYTERQAEAANSYNACLTKHIKILASDFFSADKKEAASEADKFIDNLYKTAHLTFDLHQNITQENRACAARDCGMLDGLFPFVDLMSVYESVLQDLVYTRYNKKMGLPSIE